MLGEKKGLNLLQRPQEESDLRASERYWKFEYNVAYSAPHKSGRERASVKATSTLSLLSVIITCVDFLILLFSSYRNNKPTGVMECFSCIRTMVTSHCPACAYTYKRIGTLFLKYPWLVLIPRETNRLNSEDELYMYSLILRLILVQLTSRIYTLRAWSCWKGLKYFLFLLPALSIWYGKNCTIYIFCEKPRNKMQPLDFYLEWDRMSRVIWFVHYPEANWIQNFRISVRKYACNEYSFQIWSARRKICVGCYDERRGGWKLNKTTNCFIPSKRRDDGSGGLVLFSRTHSRQNVFSCFVSSVPSGEFDLARFTILTQSLHPHPRHTLAGTQTHSFMWYLEAARLLELNLNSPAYIK